MKSRGRTSTQQSAARHALQRLRTLTAERDSFVRAQPVTEHHRVRMGEAAEIL